jgi:hypothetical protein
MKITKHKNHHVTVKLGSVVYKLQSKLDLSPELAAHLRLYAREDVLDYLYPHPSWNDPSALRHALERAIYGRPELGASILGIRVNPVIPEKPITRDEFKGELLAIGRRTKADLMAHAMKQEHGACEKLWAAWGQKQGDWSIPNHGLAWPTDHCQVIEAKVARGLLPLTELAKHLGRTRLAVFCKAINMGLNFDAEKSLCH